MPSPPDYVANWSTRRPATSARSPRLTAASEKPIIIGHSFGGLVTQLMVQRDLAAAAVVIDSVAPPGVLSLEWSFFKGTWPVLNPFAGSRPYYMSFKHYQYAFANDQTSAEQRAGYDLDIVPESRRLARGAAGQVPRVVLDAGAIAELDDHLDVEAGALLEPLRLDEPALRLQLLQPLAQLLADPLDRAVARLRRRDVVAVREDRDLVELGELHAAQGVELQVYGSGRSGGSADSKTGALRSIRLKTDCLTTR